MDIQFVLDHIIRIWGIETTKQFNVFKGHKHWIVSIKHGSNELLNTVLSGSFDKSVLFNGHKKGVWSVEYSPFVIKNSICNSNVICSGAYDNTIRFWDIRSNKNELCMIKGDDGIPCLRFIVLKKKRRQRMSTIGICVMVHGKVTFVFGDNYFFVEQKMKVFLFENLIKRKLR
ncbi:WD-40 repeat protein [Reticulomyxa filosa]|uniref:WD-40 repeat protein n=1 Tax=Reticulomyxa filosa TaxID=46433 RepID=X6PDM3_RETFI|nr:WD-40 repeat protein [Reticulomyxa filosa]|eukprot:ETO36600.1 WD-40 repeat protein [Reticulomyxa filosa]